MGAVEELFDLRIDPARRVFAVLARGHRRHVEEECLARCLERPESEGLAHPVTSHHVARHIGGTLEMVLGARRDIAEDEFLGHAAADEHVEPVQEFGARHEIPILGRLLLGVPEGGDRPGSSTRAVTNWCVPPPERFSSSTLSFGSAVSSPSVASVPRIVCLSRVRSLTVPFFTRALNSLYAHVLGMRGEEYGLSDQH
jgi:hypothetical protein